MFIRLVRLGAAVCAIMCAGLCPRADAATVTLQWDPNTEPGITGYTIAYGTRSGLYDTTVDAGTATTYTLTLNPPATTTYFIAVAARTANAVSAYSAEVSTTVTNPPANPGANTILTIDSPADGRLLPSDIYLAGWAADLNASSGTGVDALHVYAYPNPGSGAPPEYLGAAPYGTPRQDVAAAFGPQFLNSGFSMPVVGMAPGPYQIVVFAHSTVTNSFTVHQVVPVTIAAPDVPVVTPGAELYIDTPRTGDEVQNALTVAGWAADLRAGAGTGVDRVDIWAYPSPGSGTLPVFLGSAPTGGDRADVASILGTRFRPTGYTLTVTNLQPGLYDVVAFPHSTVTGASENPRAVRISVKPAVVVVVDVPAAGGTVHGTFSIEGWSIDRRATTGSGIDALHVWAYPNPGSGTAPVFLGATTTTLQRPDVAAIFGANFGSAGYSLTVTGLAPGVYDLVVFGHSSATGAFENSAVVRVTVQ